MDALRDKLRELTTTTDVSANMLANLFDKKIFHKGIMITNSSWQPLPTIIYIHSGLIKATSEYQGNAYTLWMVDSGFIVGGTDYLSNRFDESIEFLRTTTCYALSVKRVEDLTQDTGFIYKALIEMYQHAIQDYNRRLLLLNIKDARDRYIYLLENYPNLFRKLTDEQVSALLRIERRYLYRIKHNLKP